MKTRESISHNLFATREDLQSFLQAVEAYQPLQYVKCGLFDKQELPVFHGFSSLPALGLAQVGESIREPSFLVMLEGDRLNLRTVPQRGEGTRYAVDQQLNPGTVVIRLGGVYNDSALIAGTVGTVHQDEKAAKLMKTFSSALKQSFTKVKSYFVGPGAMNSLNSGWRLTHSVFAPPDFDLSA